MPDIGSVKEWEKIASKSSKDEDGCTPRFYIKPFPDKKASEVEGRSVFKPIPYVEIFIPGDKSNRPNHKVTDEDKARWPEAWRAFLDGKMVSDKGTPLEVWALMDPARIAELKVLGITTVEELSKVADGNLAKLGPGAQKLRERAKQFLQPQSKTETGLRKQNQQLTDSVKNLSDQVERLTGMVDGFEKKASAPPPPVLDLNDAREHVDQ